jgi:hypothetical protein
MRATFVTALAVLAASTAVKAAEPSTPVPSLKQSQPVPLVQRSKDSPTAPLPPQFTLQYEQRFLEPTAHADFAATDPAAWITVAADSGGYLELTRQSRYQPPVRSPVNIALLANRQFGDFVLECDLVQTGKEYGHRDMCLFFGVQNPTNFYYVHMATAADDHAHNVFIVRNAPRTKIANQTTTGVNWGLNIWHHVRLERLTETGSVKVYFDDLTTPIMVAEDKTFSEGYIGFGSFDDTGRIANIRIWAPSVSRKPAGFFQPFTSTNASDP